MNVDIDKDNGFAYPKRAVVDTCVILNIVLGASDNLPSECLPRSKKLVDDAIAGKFELLLPCMALIELSSDHLIMSHFNNPAKNIYHSAKRKIMQWCDESGLPTADLTDGAAHWFQQHREIQGVRPCDAAILSTAKYAHADVVYTWDEKFILHVHNSGQNANLGIEVKNPPEGPRTLFN